MFQLSIRGERTRPKSLLICKRFHLFQLPLQFTRKAFLLILLFFVAVKVPERAVGYDVLPSYGLLTAYTHKWEC